tara:strand:- start:6100 stop:6555 length:456 start_codon:yes stop_codon:yes gene_type:complete
MKNLNFNEFKMNIKNKENKNFIFDIVRKKWFLLTKEEWVRQNCVHYLIHTKKYPISLISVEKKILINGLNKRYDIVVYSKYGEALILVECKSYDIKLSQNIFDQIARYNLKLKSKFLMITNGLSHYFYTINYELKNYSFIIDLPEYKKENL